MTDYEKIYCFKNIYKAYKATIKGKRNKREVIQYEADLSMNLWNLYHELEHHTYQLSGYYYFRVYDPKVREIQALTLRDRVVQHSLCDNVLRPYFEPRLIYDSAACREGKGTRFATDRLTSFLRKYYKKNGVRKQTKTTTSRGWGPEAGRVLIFLGLLGGMGWI